MITRVRLQHFRSYTDASFSFGPGVTIIVGPNASGKTNLLEAVLLLARGNSYRAKDYDLVQFGADWARLDAQLEHGQRTLKIKLESPEKAVKRFEIDGQSLSRLTPARTLPVVLFEPNHLQLLSGSPEARRGFLDDLLEQTLPSYGATRRHYKRVLAQRNALLKKNPRHLKEQLFVWNIRLSELGGQIVRERMQLVAQFGEQLGELYAALAQKTGAVGLAYQAQLAADNYETALLHKLESSLELEVLRGFTAYGPHRDDFLATINTHPVQDAASRGETRTFVLALKILELQLLEAARSQRPLLLLDDVFSELDTTRRHALTDFFANHQVLITTTDADVVSKRLRSSPVIALQ